MKPVLLLITLFCTLTTNAWSQPAQNLPFRSALERRDFGRYLFCRGDYLRAAAELGQADSGDTTKLQLAICLLQIGATDSMVQTARGFADTSFSSELSKYYYKTLFQQKKFDAIIKWPQASLPPPPRHLLLASEILKTPGKTEGFLLKDSLDNSIYKVGTLYQSYHKKSPILAAALSAVIPGAGKIYVGKVSDGITAFVLTSLFGYITYANIRHDHQTRAWISGSITALLWGGAVYGSAAEAIADYHKQQAAASEQLFNFTLQNQCFFQFSVTLPCK